MSIASNSQSPQIVELLEESERFAYLSAMEVPLWVERDFVNEPSSSRPSEILNNEAMNNEAMTNSGTTAGIDSSVAYRKESLKQEPQARAKSSPESSASVQQESKAQELKVQHIANDLIRSSSTRPESGRSKTEVSSNPPIEVLGDRSDDSNVSTNTEAESRESGTRTINNSVSAQYLKMVNWVAGAESATNLLIVCRHQTDQPAQSFARNNSPSRFMQDYVQTLIGLCGAKGHDIKVSLGHLSEAGLSSHCETLDSVVERLQPSAMLLLGDETVKALLAKPDEIGSLRGRVHATHSITKAIVSYHPYTLIKNASLKKLAMDDLKMLTQLLSADAT